jgi:hypothetical protein
LELELKWRSKRSNWRASISAFHWPSACSLHERHGRVVAGSLQYFTWSEPGGLRRKRDGVAGASKRHRSWNGKWHIPRGRSVRIWI